MLSEARERYEELMQSPDHIEAVLQEGAVKARAHAAPLMAKVRDAIGISPIR